MGVEHIRELHEQSVLNVAKADSHLVKSGALELHCADGFTGWPDGESCMAAVCSSLRACTLSGAPYDCIHIGAAAPNAKSLETVLGQLASGGVLISPVGPDGGNQELMKFTRGEVHSAVPLYLARVYAEWCGWMAFRTRRSPKHR